MMKTHASQKRHRCVKEDDVFVQKIGDRRQKSKKWRRRHAMSQRQQRNSGLQSVAVTPVFDLCGTSTGAVRIAAYSLIYFVYTPPVYRCVRPHPFPKPTDFLAQLSISFCITFKDADWHSYLYFIHFHHEGDFHLGMKLTWVPHVFVHTREKAEWEHDFLSKGK